MTILWGTRFQTALWSVVRHPYLLSTRLWQLRSRELETPRNDAQRNLLKTLTMAAGREFVLLLILSMCDTGAPPRCFEVRRGNPSFVGTIILKAYSKSHTLCIVIDLPVLTGLGDRETCSTFLERVSAETCMRVRGGSWTLQPCQPNVDGKMCGPTAALSGRSSSCAKG